MVCSTRRAISVILLLTFVVPAHAQNVPTKEVTSSISGRVTIKGKGAPGITVCLRIQEPGYRQQPTLNRAITDLNGDYRILNVPAGNYMVIPVAPSYVLPEQFGSKTLLVEKGETIEHIDFAFVRGGVITGKVLDPDGRPVIEEDVVALPMPVRNREYSEPRTARTDDRGVYRIFGIPAGPYKVAAGRDEENSYPGRTYVAYKRTYHPETLDPREAKVIEVSEGSEATNVDITLNRALSMYTATGRLVDADTGQPLANLSYGITHFVTEHHTSSWSNGAVSNARGEFKFDGLVPGKYAVSLRQGPAENDWRSDLVYFEVTDQDVTGLVIKCKKGATISGVVVLDGTDDKTAREQLARTVLTATIAETTDQSWGQWTKIAPDGSFRMTGLRSGLASFYFPSSNRFRVARIEHGGVVQPRGIEVAEGQQVTGIRVIVSYGNASIRGVIELENGTLPENARFFVQLRKPNEDPYRYTGDPNPQVDARGQFIVEDVTPGNYELHVGLYLPGPPPEFIEKKQDVVLVGGMPLKINVKLDMNSKRARP